MVNFTLRPLYSHQTSPTTTPGEGSGWAVKPVVTFRRREKYLTFTGIGAPGFPSHRLVSIRTTVHWLLYNLCCSSNITIQICFQGDGMDGTCRDDGGDEKCLWNFFQSRERQTSYVESGL